MPKTKNHLTVITHADCELHCIPNHPESPQRLKAVLSQLENTNQLQQSLLATQ
jgi:hypothetical protein